MDDDSLRDKLGAMMAAGLPTEWQTRAYASEEVNAVVARLQDLAPDDYEQKLVIGGFTLEPYESDEIEQSCRTCMYYLKHRKYCELPELAVPVEPEWSCVVWRI
jgi:hypothetical protein